MSSRRRHLTVFLGWEVSGDSHLSVFSVWFDNHTPDSSRRTSNTSTVTSSNNPHVNETVASHHSKGSSQTHSSSQSHYNHHSSGQQYNQYTGQPYWNNYNNPRRGGNYNRNYSGGTNDTHWNSKANRFPSHRSMNNLMNNAGNYQQQSQASPPAQRRQGDQSYYHNDQQQSSQSYYKSRSHGLSLSLSTMFRLLKKTEGIMIVVPTVITTINNNSLQTIHPVALLKRRAPRNNRISVPPSRIQVIWTRITDNISSIEFVVGNCTCVVRLVK